MKELTILEARMLQLGITPENDPGNVCLPIKREKPKKPPRRS